MSQGITKTFAALELQPIITADELIETLREYATSGAAVDHHVVTSIIDRVSPDQLDKMILQELVQTGIDRQSALKQHAAAYHYQVVLTHLKFGRRL